jgi:hypothetical protein
MDKLINKNLIIMFEKVKNVEDGITKKLEIEQMENANVICGVEEYQIDNRVISYMLRQEGPDNSVFHALDDVFGVDSDQYLFIDNSGMTDRSATLMKEAAIQKMYDLNDPKIQEELKKLAAEMNVLKTKIIEMQDAGEELFQNVKMIEMQDAGEELFQSE